MTARSTDEVEELKPCPFCGTAAEIVTYGSGKISRASVRCSDKACGAHLRLGLPGESLIAAWNTRHESEALTVMREALERLAKAADGYSDTIPDRAHLIYGEVTVGDCRKAREALARIGRS